MTTDHDQRFASDFGRKERAEVRAEMLARLRRATRAGRSVQIGADDATLLLELLEVE